MGELIETEGFVPAKDNLRLFWREVRPAQPKAEVAVVHGYADHSGRYLDVLRHLANNGYVAHGLDYRGHGQADGRRSHIDRFSEYLDDLDVFFARIRERSDDRKIFGLGHSQGALILLSYGITRPTAEVAGAVISNPYLALAFAPPKFLVMLSGVLSKILPWLPVKNELQPEMLTRDPDRQRAVRSDPLYNSNATPRWFVESNRAQLEVRLRAREFTWPTLFLVGQEDPIAKPQAARELFARLGSRDKEILEYPGFRHEILNEVGREQAFADLTRWFDARVPAGTSVA